MSVEAVEHEPIVTNSIGMDELDSHEAQILECLARSGRPVPFFHPSWLKVVAKSFPVKIGLIIAKRGNSLAGLLPYYEMRSSFSAGQIRTFECPINCWDQQTNDALAGALFKLSVELGINRVEICGLAESGLDGFFKADNRTAALIDLERGYDNYLESLGGRVRNRIARAQEAGYVTGFAEAVKLPHFYEIYRRRLLQHGVPEPGTGFFNTILQETGLGARLFLVSKDGLTVGGAICVETPKGLSAIYGAVTSEAARDHASYALYSGLAKNTSEQKERKLDLGSSRTGSGAHKFKMKWNPDFAAIPSHTTVEGDQQVHSTGLGRLFKQTWRHLPSPVARHLGPLIRKRMPFG